MYIFISIMIIIACILMILVVLVQNSKGGGLVSNFSSSNQIMGVKRTTDFLEKTTWTIAIAIVILSLVTVATIPNRSVASAGADNELMDQAAPAQQTAPAPAAGSLVPEQTAE